MVNRVDHQHTSSEQTTMGSIETNRTMTVKKTDNHVKEEKENNEEKLSLKEAEDMVGSLNKFLKSADSRLKFVLHDKLETYYVTIIDNETDEVIQEIPSEKLMNIRAAMKEFVGLLIDQKI